MSLLLILGTTCDQTNTERSDQQIVEKTGVTYENVIAPGAFDQFINKLAGVPTTVFIDKNGKVVGEAVVGAKVEEYKQHVEDYLNEQK